MNGLVSARGWVTRVLGVAVLAAMLMLAAGASQAAPGGGHGSDRGGRGQGGGGGHSYGGGGRSHGGGGGRGHDGGGGRNYNGGGGHTYGGGGGRSYGGGGGYAYGGGRVRVYGGGVPYYGGGHYYGSRVVYRRPYSYRYVRPSSYISFGIGLGLPYYCPPAYRYYPVPYPVEVESGIQVDNEPPAGCYYYDRFCDQEFSTLDEYTDHVEAQDHPRTIEIIVRSSGDRLRTLEFVGGYWSVMR